MPKELFFPSGFDMPALTPKQELDLAYFRMFPNEENKDLNVNESMIDFCNRVSGQPLNELMANYLKEDRIPPCFDFLLTPVFGTRYQTINDTTSKSNFYMDTERGFALGVLKKDANAPTWVGVIGIDMGNELADYTNNVDEAGKLMGVMDFKRALPVIAQIQGPNEKYTYYDKSLIIAGRKYNTAMQILENYKWERALIALTQDWAILNRFPALYLLPADKNRWLNTNYHQARLKMRYDVSAQRSGFTMQPNGLYGISLLGAKPEVAI